MQKVAGDVEAIDKVCDILVTLKITDEDATSPTDEKP